MGMRMKKHVIDFFRTNETATTAQVAEYINSKTRSAKGGLSVSIQEMGMHLRKWCVRIDMVPSKIGTISRKITLWALKEEFQ